MSEDVRSLLLEALASRAGVSSASSVPELLTQLGEADPTVSLIAKYLAQRQAEQLETETSSDEDVDSEFSPRDGEPGESELLSSERARSVRRLRQKIGNMRMELEELQERNDTLAAALGACYLCWGEDPECHVCGGRGHPGFSMPDRVLFAQFVPPAVRRLPKRESVDQDSSRNTDPRVSPSPES